MRQIQVPFIADFEEVDLDTALELEGARFQVDQVNWPAAFPYAPLCAGRIARTEDALVVDFRVSGLDLRALNTEDNGSQWEDSCVEVEANTTTSRSTPSARSWRRKAPAARAA